jgi:segregation and condensation protein B
LDTPPPQNGLPGPWIDSFASRAHEELLSVAQAARRLGVARSRVYQLVSSGALDDAGTQPLRLTAVSVERRAHAAPPVGALLAPLGAWAVLALACGDPALRAHVAGLLSDPDRSRARSRLQRQSFLTLVPRLRARSINRRFAIAPERRVDILADARLVLAGSTAARALAWDLPSTSDSDQWPLEAYVAEGQLAAVFEEYQLERDDSGDILLRSVPEPWPFPPHARVVPPLVAALDLTESIYAPLAELGAGRLTELAVDVVADWQQRPPRRRPIRPLIPTGASALHAGPTRRRRIDQEIWEDRAEQDADHLVALLFVAASAVRRVEVAETLRVGPARLSRACAVLRADPPRGLRLQESGDRLGLVSAPDCAAVVERHFGQPVPEPLSQAALETLSIVAYEQPVTRADIRGIRGVDSDAVVETLMSRGLVAEDPHFGGRGRPAFLVTTPIFLRTMGLGSLTELPPRPAPSHADQPS